MFSVVDVELSVADILSQHYHTRGPAAAKLLLLKVLCVRSTTRPVGCWSEKAVAAVGDKVEVINQICRCQTRQRLVQKACDLVVDSSPDRKLVKLVQHMHDVITLSGAGDELCGGVQDL